MEIFKYEELSKHLGLPVVRIVLPNGATIFVAEKVNSKLVHVGLIFACGSLDDGDYPGTAHFIEHLVFDGGASDGIHPKLKPIFLKGGGKKASTGVSSTQYILHGLVEEFPSILSSLLSICYEARFTEEMVDRERNVILQETREDEMDSFTPWLHKTLYPRFPILQYPIGGTKKSINTVTSEELAKFHHQWYRPINTAIIVVGGISYESAIEVILQSHLSWFTEQKMDAPRQRELILPEFLFTEYRDLSDPPSLTLYFSRPHDRREHAYLEFTKAMLTDQYGLLVQKLRMKERVIYGSRISQTDWPVLCLIIATPAPPELFEHIEESIFQSIKQIVHCEYSDELLKCILAERHFFYEFNRDQLSFIKIADSLHDLWIEGNLDDVDYEVEIAPQVLAGVTAKYLNNYQYGRVLAFEKP